MHGAPAAPPDDPSAPAARMQNRLSGSAMEPFRAAGAAPDPERAGIAGPGSLRVEDVQRLRLLFVVRDHVVAGTAATLLDRVALGIDVVLVVAAVTARGVLEVTHVGAPADLHVREVVLTPLLGEHLSGGIYLGLARRVQGRRQLRVRRRQGRGNGLLRLVPGWVAGFEHRHGLALDEGKALVDRPVTERPVDDVL